MTSSFSFHKQMFNYTLTPFSAVNISVIDSMFVGNVYVASNIQIPQTNGPIYAFMTFGGAALGIMGQIIMQGIYGGYPYRALQCDFFVYLVFHFCFFSRLSILSYSPSTSLFFSQHPRLAFTVYICARPVFSLCPSPFVLFFLFVSMSISLSRFHALAAGQFNAPMLNLTCAGNTYSHNNLTSNDSLNSQFITSGMFYGGGASLVAGFVSSFLLCSVCCLY